MPQLPTPGASEDTWGDELNTFLEVAHTATGEIDIDAIPESATRVFVTPDQKALIGSGSAAVTVTTVAGLRALSGPSSTALYETTDYGGGLWIYDSTDTTSVDNTATVVVTSDHGRLKRIYDGTINVKWFGAIGNNNSHPLSGYFGSLGQAQAVYPSASSLNDEIDAVAIQEAVNLAIANGGGTVFCPIGQYRLNKTIYVNPGTSGGSNEGCPITIKGGTETLKDDNTTKKGTFFVMIVDGDMMRVNINADGSPYLNASAGYFAFAIDGIAFKSDGLHATRGIRMYRTRSVCRNLYAMLIDGLIVQDNNAPAGYGGTWNNYCDQSIYENIRMYNMRAYGMQLSIPDASVLNGILH